MMSYAIPILTWLSTALGISGVGSTLSSGSVAYLFTLAPLGLLVLVIAPAFLWISEHEKVVSLTTPKLSVDVPSKPLTSGWYHLIVRNPTGVPIKDCYAKLIDFRSLTRVDPDSELPPIGIKYPWSTLGGSSSPTVTRDIGPRSFDILDIAVCKHDDPDYFYTPILSADGYRRYMEYPLPVGTYEMDIEVGSDTMDFPPTHATFEVRFLGGYQLQVK